MSSSRISFSIVRASGGIHRRKFLGRKGGRGEARSPRELGTERDPSQKLCRGCCVAAGMTCRELARPDQVSLGFLRSRQTRHSQEPT